MKVTKQVIEKIAERACVSLDQEKVAYYQEQMEKILSHMEQINQFEFDDEGEERVEATPEREDLVYNSNTEAILKQAPDKKGTAFRVPLVVE